MRGTGSRLVAAIVTPKPMAASRGSLGERDLEPRPSTIIKWTGAHVCLGGPVPSPVWHGCVGPTLQVARISSALVAKESHRRPASHGNFTP